jgi:hypothetical protein
VSENPTDITLSNQTILESFRTGFTVGTLSATDPQGDPITWSLVSGQGDNNSFAIKTEGDVTRVVLTSPIDHEASGGVYDLVVRATDSSGNFTDRTIPITVLDEPFKLSGVPTGKDYLAVVESAPIGTKIGFISDFDYDDSFDSYMPTSVRLIDDAGGLFSITSGFTFDRTTNTQIPREFLTVNGNLDHETTDLYSVTIEVTGSDGSTRQKTYQVHVIDAPELTDPGIQPKGTITIDANTAAATQNGGVDWTSYLDDYFAKVIVQLPTFLPLGSGWSASNPASEMRMMNFTTDPNDLISIGGSGFFYNWADPVTGEDVHIITGTITNVTFGQGEQGGTPGVLEMTSPEVTISGLNLSNDASPMNRLFGEAQIFTQSWMYGNQSQPSDIVHTKAILASYAQNFIGSSAADTYAGTIFDDTMRGGKGDDTLSGGAGTDTAIFSGNRADYTITKNSDGTHTVADNRADADGTATVSDIERLQFADQTVDIMPQSTSDFLVNTNVAGAQDRQTVTVLDNGNFVVVWTSADGLDSGATPAQGIRAQLFAENGTPIGSEILVNAQGDNSQTRPVVEALDGGGFMVTWVSWIETGGSNATLRARSFDSSGVAGTPDDVVIADLGASTNPDFVRPAITALDNGNYLLVWNQQPDGGATGQDAMAQVRRERCCRCQPIRHPVERDRVPVQRHGGDACRWHASSRLRAAERREREQEYGLSARPRRGWDDARCGDHRIGRDQSGRSPCSVHCRTR